MKLISYKTALFIIFAIATASFAVGVINSLELQGLSTLPPVTVVTPVPTVTITPTSTPSATPVKRLLLVTPTSKP